MTTESDSPTVEMYQDVLEIWEKGRIRGLNEGYKTTDPEIVCIDNEIARIRLHIHRLKTNHADCVQACCPACTCGGINENSG